MISDSEQQQDTVFLRKLLQQNKRAILLSTFIGAVTGLLTAFLLPKEYKSAGVVFPPSAPSVEASIENPNFGYDVEADRLIQIFQSNEVRDSVVKKFGLYAYYDLEKNENESKDALIRKYKSDIHFERTPSMSIILSAQTRSAELSSDIINYIIGVTDKVREKIYKQNLRTSFENAQAEYDSHKHKVDSMQAILLRKLQENNLSSLIILASNAQISIDMDKLQNRQTDISGLSIGSDIITFRNLQERMRESEGKLLRLKKILSTPIPKLFVIDYAEPRYKKVFPSGLSFLISGAVAGFIIILIVLLARNTIDLRRK